MTKFAFYMPRLNVGGAERATLWMARELKRRDHAVSFIVDRQGGGLEAEFTAQFPITYLNAPQTAFAGPRLAAAVRETAPDVLVAVMTYNILTAALMKRFGLIRTRLVGWEHSVLSPMRAARGARGVFEARAIRALYPVCEKIICVSRGAVADAEALCAPRLIDAVCVYNPVPTPTPQPLTPKQIGILERLSAPRIMTVGRLSSVKDQRTLLRAFQAFSRRHGGSLLIIGDGERRRMLEFTASGLGLGDRVMFAGEMANPSVLLAHADLFALSSLSESFGLALVEALALGVPVVSTDCPTAPREILADGRFGRLVPVGDARALARAMWDALQTKHDKEALRARAAEFSEARSADAFLAALSEPSPAPAASGQQAA